MLKLASTLRFVASLAAAASLSISAPASAADCTVADLFLSRDSGQIQRLSLAFDRDARARLLMDGKPTGLDGFVNCFVGGLLTCEWEYAGLAEAERQFEQASRNLEACTKKPFEIDEVRQRRGASLKNGYISQMLDTDDPAFYTRVQIRLELKEFHGKYRVEVEFSRIEKFPSGYPMP